MDNPTVGSFRLSRRRWLQCALGASIVGRGEAVSGTSSTRVVDYSLRVANATVGMLGDEHPKTKAWTYNGDLPGPTLRARQGDRLRVTVKNELNEPTTVHWHGMRLPNAMDGVPHLTQSPIEPDASFTYEFELTDAGSYWYHPHFNSAEQIGRGLYGALIIDERQPVSGFDRDVIWLLDDWRLDQNGALQAFGNRHDLTHAGRMGNSLTINGRLPETLVVRTGERLRLRLLNVANARHFALQFEHLDPQIIAYDGQPVQPHSIPGERLVIAPAQRVDLLIDATGEPGSRARIVDTYYRDAFLVNDLRYSDKPPLDPKPESSISLPNNPLNAPNLSQAERIDVQFAGGAMGQMQGAHFNGTWTDIRTLVRNGMAWSINGIAASEHVSEPLLTLQEGKSYLLVLENATAFPHPIHLHGHHFQVIRRNRQPTAHSEWRDTVLVDPNEQVEIGLLADNPGDWMFHCHVPEHMEAGMMAVIRVA